MLEVCRRPFSFSLKLYKINLLSKPASMRRAPLEHALPLSKDPCTHMVYTLALKQSLHSYFGAKVYTIWAHGPLESQP